MNKSRRKVTLAKDCKCVKCKEPAVAFWPCIDPDIQSFPYCRKCLDKSQTDLILKLQELKKP